MILAVCSQSFPSVSDSWKRRLTFNDKSDSDGAQSDNTSSFVGHGSENYCAEKGANDLEEEEVQHEVVKSGIWMIFVYKEEKCDSFRGKRPSESSVLREILHSGCLTKIGGRSRSHLLLSKVKDKFSSVVIWQCHWAYRHLWRYLVLNTKSEMLLQKILLGLCFYLLTIDRPSCLV